MAPTAGHLSENSRRLARNTLLLYFRMFLLLLIGLFTSRVVLRTLGVDDYGVYNVVGGVVTVFTFLAKVTFVFVFHSLTQSMKKFQKKKKKKKKE